MYKLSRYIIPLILVLLSIGCTRNDGDIGPWYGQWKLVELTSASQPVAGYKDNIFFAFQNNIIQIVTIKSEVDEAICWGEWKEQDNKLVLDFDHREDASDEDNWNYTPPAILGFSPTSTYLDIVKLSGSEIILRQSIDGVTQYTYRLKKWG